MTDIDNILVYFTDGAEQNKFLGNGFIVSNEGHVLTCWHLFKNIKSEDFPKILVNNKYKCQVIEKNYNQINDWIILKVEELIRKEVYPIDLNFEYSERKIEYKAHSFIEVNNEYKVKPIIGNILRKDNTINAYELNCEHSKQILPGDSGSPVIVNEKIVGYITMYEEVNYFGNMVFGGYSRLLKDIPLLVEIVQKGNIIIQPDSNINIEFLKERRKSLKSQLDTLYKLLNEYENNLLLEDNPKKKLKNEREIEDIKKNIENKNKEFDEIEEKILKKELEEKNIEDTNKTITQITENIYTSHKIESDLTLIEKSIISESDLLKNLNNASVDLCKYKNYFGNAEKLNISRIEVENILSWIKFDLQPKEPNIAILTGNAGYGKSVVMKDLFDTLQNEKIPVLGIKSDLLKAKNSAELTNELNIGDEIEKVFNKLIETNEKVVLLVDQIDALSLTLSTDRTALNVYNRLIGRLEKSDKVRIVISCRIYDLYYDPFLQQYKNKKIFRLEKLTIENVELVLKKLEIPYQNSNKKLLEFLSIPLHLEIFTKIKDRNLTEFTLNELYNIFWEEKILDLEGTEDLKSKKVIEFIKKITDEMYNNQEIVVSEILFEDEYKKEIKYLRSQNVITNQNIENKKLQFTHQSFFDYSFARTFVNNGNTISSDIKDKHQGLFIRSKVKQVLNYMRDVKPNIYIKELETILSSDVYRFHIRLLLINELVFIKEPTIDEKEIVKDIIINDKKYFIAFLEAVFSCKWWNFLNEIADLKKCLVENYFEFSNPIFSLCSKLVNSCQDKIVFFLDTLPEINDKINFIARIISFIKTPNDNTIKFFKKIKKNINDYEYYRFLENSLNYNVDFVISELKEKFYLHKIDKDLVENIYIPGDYQSSEIYKNLFKLYPKKAIPFFEEIIIKIIEIKKVASFEKPKNSLYGDWAFYHFIPFKEQNHNDLHHSLYEFILEYYESELNLNNIMEVKIKFKEFLLSDFTSILNIPVTLMKNNPKEFLNEIYQLFNRPEFFINYEGLNDLFAFNVRELLKESFSFFSQEKQKHIENLILKAIPEHEKKKNFIKSDINYSITHQGYNMFQLLKMLPKEYINANNKLLKEYQELNRKFPYYKHEKPKGIVVYSGHRVLSKIAYEKMTDEDWINSFRKYQNTKKRNWEDIDELGHCRIFEEEVSKDYSKYLNLINKIIDDSSIPVSYVVYGLQGLKKANYDVKKTRELFKNVVEKRNIEIKSKYLIYLVWFTDYFIEKNAVNEFVFNFLKDVVLNYTDGKMLNNDPVNDGINTARGAAARNLVYCYKFNEFGEQIFSTLESIYNTSIITRASALYVLAMLTKLDKQKTLTLFFKLISDYEPKLLALPLHNLNPLLYLIHYNFESLIPYFEKCIEIEETHKVTTHLLFFAWLNNYPKSKELLGKILEKSLIAKIKVIEVAFENIKYNKYFDKCNLIIEKYLNEESKEISETYQHGFHHLNPKDFNKHYAFIVRFSKSKVGIEKGHNFYDYILKSVNENTIKCLDLIEDFKNFEKGKELFLSNEKLQIIIQSYNALRKYKNKSDNLEKAMDIFDKFLSSSNYRRELDDVLNKLQN